MRKKNNEYIMIKMILLSLTNLSFQDLVKLFSPFGQIESIRYSGVVSSVLFYFE